ncbi:type II toxin-antitoxin system RelE/ParE family toxin [Vibrio diabolicus]|uniref:type II toxin-antitoxin system RelE/ParE family toxin n=1 Tax=Vibrio diabolicus TaxID=50719 RepID=UPI003D7E9980
MEKIIHSTPLFDEWLKGLKDPKAKAAVASRVQRLKFGLYGDCEPVGKGISELRIHIGKGYRVYFKEQDKVITIVLCGGDKKTQTKDIKLAKKLAEDLGL